MSSLPPGVTIGDAGLQTAVTERGYFCRIGDSIYFTACMFAALAELLIWAGYRVPLARKKSQTPPENFVFQLQTAGDPTPKTGSTIAQSQAALRKLLPDAPVLFGALTPTELAAALFAGAKIRVIVDCSKLPREMKTHVGQGYAGGHACNMSEPELTDGELTVLWTDPMGKPWQRYAGERRAWLDFDQALKTTSDGKIIVTLTYKSAAVPKKGAPA